MLLAGVVAAVALAVVVLGGGTGGGSESTEVLVSGASEGPAALGPLASGSAGSNVPVTSAQASAGPSASAVVVHVAGAVADAGIVTLPAGSRVAAAVERAGGAVRDADLGRLNLARLLVDGERVYVPRVGEDDPPPEIAPDVPPGDAAVAPGSGGSGAAEGVVDLNSADAAELETLPGIGPALAARIIAWRAEHGRFSSVEDLLDVSGIGDAKFADLRDRVRV